MTAARFQPRLESIRGIAALMVALFHALAMIQIDGWVPLKIRAVLQLAGNGNGAVAIFFVLSGYVLAASLDASASSSAPRLLPETLSFAIRRTFRIWPAMAVCLVACFLWVWLVFEPRVFDAASTDYQTYWRARASWSDLRQDLLFRQSYFDPVTWTLAVEMIAAVLFVPLWWIYRRWRIVLMVLTAAWAAWFLATPHPSRTAYLFMMLLGMIVEPAARFATRHLGGRALTISLLLSFVGSGLAMQYPRETAAATWFLHGLFAYAIVALLVSSEGRVRLPWLDRPAARFMGRISYSFYLWHFPVLYVLTTAGFGTIAADRWQQSPIAMALLVFVVSTLVTIPIAWLSHRAIELPMIRTARKIIPHRN